MEGSPVLHGFTVALQPMNLFYCMIGVTAGTFVGVLPGIGALAAISMLLPITYYMEPTAALIMLAGIFYGAQYGGSTASILMNLPGTAANAVTCLDGYPMSKQGRAGPALFVTTVASFVGGSIAILLLIYLAPAFARMALSFGAAEYAAVMVFGLVAGSTMWSGSTLKGIAMVVIGVLLGTVGIDMHSGFSRFQFGSPQLAEGFSLVAVAMGLFGVAEILANLLRSDGEPLRVQRVTARSLMPTRDDVRRSVFPTLRGAASGSAMGILPGAGPTIAAFLAYAVERRVAREPERFGKGAVEGVAAPESANNAAVQAAFIPTLSLGIPGDATSAVLLGALMIHGIAPGPNLVTTHPDLFWGLVASFWIGNVLLLILNIPLIGVWVSILRIPYRALYPAMLFFICLGVYSVNNSMFDVYVMIGFGLFGTVAAILNFPVAPLLLGFILGPLIEENVRNALLISRGNFSVFLQSGLSISFLVAAAGLIVLSVWSALRARRRHVPVTQEG